MGLISNPCPLAAPHLAGYSHALPPSLFLLTPVLSNDLMDQTCINATTRLWDKMASPLLRSQISYRGTSDLISKPQLMTVATSTASNSIDMDPFLLQTIGLSSDYDAVHFSSDLVREEDENTWNGLAQPRHRRLELKRGACIPSLVIDMVISHRALLNILIRSSRVIESYPHWSSCRASSSGYARCRTNV